MAYTLTPEQERAREMYLSGESLALRALAGTGKTFSLRQMALADPNVPIQYLAFNRGIVADAAGSFPPNVTASTIHKVAMREVGYQFRHRLGGDRMPSREIARRLRIDPSGILTVNEFGRKVLQAGYLAGYVMRSLERFCLSADPVPDVQHFAWIEGIDVAGRATNNERVRQTLLPALRRAWDDLSDPDGELPYRHYAYLRLWELGGIDRDRPPRLPVAVVMLDEAQDLDAVMISIAAKQDHAQVIYVGDDNQQIYQWRGAINALQKVEVVHQGTLTKSFRFGQLIADVGNDLLAALGCPLRMTGNESVDSTVGTVDDPHCILTRTNAMAMTEMLAQLARGRKVHLVGGGDDVLRFAEAVKQLKEQGWTSNAELACFSSWNEVVRYAQEDELGLDLRLMVRLIEDFGLDNILKALGAQATEDEADVVITTTHRSKGRQWKTVKLAADFPPLDDRTEEAEKRLLYVAVTRAQEALDVSNVRGLGFDEVGPAVEVLPGISAAFNEIIAAEFGPQRRF